MQPIKATKKRQKNFFPTLILTLVFWGLTTIIISSIEPELIKDILIPNSYLVLFVPLSLAVFFTISVLLASSRRGLIATIAFIGFLILRLNGLGNLLNLILILGLCLATEYYFTQRHQDDA